MYPDMPLPVFPERKSGDLIKIPVYKFQTIYLAEYEIISDMPTDELPDYTEGFSVLVLPLLFLLVLTSSGKNYSWQSAPDSRLPPYTVFHIIQEPQNRPIKQ